MHTSYLSTNEPGSGDAVSIIGTAHLPFSALNETVVSAGFAGFPPGNMNAKQTLRKRLICWC